MRTVEELIVRARRETRNANTNTSSSGSSIADAEFVDALSDGQELCQELITNVFSKLFETTKVYTVTAGDETYNLPNDILLGTRIGSVEYSRNSNSGDYYNIHPVDIRERYSGSSVNSQLAGYIRSGNEIILTPKPNGSGLLRVTYERKVLSLDVSKLTLLTASRTTTDLDITWTASAQHTDVANWDIGDTVNVLDRSDNSMLVKDGAISALGSGTATIDLTNATYVAATVDAATAANLRVVEGGRTNISELPGSCEKFISAYCNLVIFERDSSKLAKAAEKKFERIKQSLLQSYIGEDTDFPVIPETDY